METHKRVETLDHLIEVTAQHAHSSTTSMLRSLKGHIALAASMDASKIALSELVSLKPALRLYLGKKQDEGHFTRNTVRSYMNYFRILLEKAGKVGECGCSPEIQALWSPIAAALSHVYGCRDIVRDALRKGIPPQDYSEQHLKGWCEQLARSGRHPTYIRTRVHSFRKRIMEAALCGQLPKLSFKARKPLYGMPLEKFPEPLRTHANSVLEWKQAPYVRGRPNRYHCRPVTVRGLEQLFCGIVGFAEMALGKTPQTLAGLLCEEIVSRYAEWLLSEREVDPLTVVDRVRLIPPLGKHPLLKGQDFKWVRDIVSDLPPHSANKVKERKQRNFVRFDVLAKVVGQLTEKAMAATDTKKKAILVRNALLLEFLLVLAWRQRNIRECRLAPSSAGGNIFKEEIPPMSTMALPKSAENGWRVNPHATFWQISFDANGTKSKRPVRAVLPRQLIPLLETYIQLRPVFLGPGVADVGTLFLNDHGKPLTAGTLAHHVAGITNRYVGKRINPHLFRDIHAEWWLASGRHLDGLSNTLWHRDSSFTRKVYGSMFDESHGTKEVEDWLENTNLGNVDHDERPAGQQWIKCRS